MLTEDDVRRVPLGLDLDVCTQTHPGQVCACDVAELGLGQ
jgi:hypothetical protein